VHKFDAGVIFDLTHLVPYILQYELSSAAGYVRVALERNPQKAPTLHPLEHPLITLKIHHKTTYRYLCVAKTISGRNGGEDRRGSLWI